MSKAIRVPRSAAAALALAVVVVLLLIATVIAVQAAVTIGDLGSNPTVHAVSAGGSGIAKDPYIDRYAGLVARYR